MDDLQDNSHGPLDGTSPSDAPPEQKRSLSTRNCKEPTSTPVPTSPLKFSERETIRDLILEEAKKLPDVRQDRIKRIRAALQSREYHISSDLVADKILENMQLDESSRQE